MLVTYENYTKMHVRKNIKFLSLRFYMLSSPSKPQYE